jgi:hypothetical protein
MVGQWTFWVLGLLVIMYGGLLLGVFMASLDKR